MITSDKNGLATVKSFPNEMDTVIAKGYLEGDGIKSFIFKDDCGGTSPYLQYYLGVELKVRQEDFDRASELLKDFEIENPTPEKLKPGENKAAFISLFGLLAISVGGGFLLSESFGKDHISIGLILIIAGILIEICASKMKKNIKNM